MSNIVAMHARTGHTELSGLYRVAERLGNPPAMLAWLGETARSTPERRAQMLQELQGQHAQLLDAERPLAPVVPLFGAAWIVRTFPYARAGGRSPT